MTMLWERMNKSQVDQIILATMVIKIHNVQLPENLVYLGLHPPKQEKLHPSKFFHSMNICHFHNDLYEPKFYP